MNEDLCDLDAGTLRRLYGSGELSPVEVTDAVLARVERRDGELNAFVTVTADLARRQAREAERRYRSGDDAPLLGVPVTLKDLVPTAGIRTAKGSLRTADLVPDADAPVAARVRESGAVPLGKTTTSELGWKADAGNRVNGPARNPCDPSRTAGGSSGGAAAAVAAGFGPLAQGGDGAGSIRIPAAFCGIVGIKPSVGVVPYDPPSPLGPLAVMGPLARTVADAALFLDALAGPDPRDPRARPHEPGTYARAAATPAGRLRIGFAPALGGRTAEPAVEAVVRAAVGRLAAAGHDVEEVAGTPEDRFDLLDLLWSTGFAALLPGGGDDLDPGLAAVIATASRHDGPAVVAAGLERQAYRGRISDLLVPYDVLVTPTVSVPAFPVGTDGPAAVSGVPANYLDWAWFTYTFNLSEHPAVTLPCGVTPDGLPVGLQLVAAHHADHALISAAAAAERDLG